MASTDNNKVLPLSASDILLHQKDSSESERIVFPVTRYKDVLNSPSVVSDSDEIFGAPFHLLEIEDEEEEMTVSEIRKLLGLII
jgi:hypothetical protein